MDLKRDKKTLLQDAIQETRYRESTFNHDISYVRDAIGKKTARKLVLCVVVAMALVVCYVLLEWS